jgi:hypothetical protein
MKKTCILLLFLYSLVHSSLIAQEDFRDAYKEMGLKPMDSLNYPYHIRLMVNESVLLDIYQKEDTSHLEGYEYHYVFQETKHLMNNVFIPVNKYVYEIDTLSRQYVKQIVHITDSVMNSDAKGYMGYRIACGRLNPTIEINYDINDSIIQTAFYSEDFQGIFTDCLTRNKGFIENLDYGRFIHPKWSLNLYKFDRNAKLLTGVSSSFANREEQNNWIEQNSWLSDFELRNKKPK